jgi:hemolysin III
VAWLTAAVGIYLQIFFKNLPSLVAVGLYLLMGWGIILAYFELARAVTHRSLLLAFWGGIFYSVGAAVHVMGWPVLVPGYFGAHDLFHILVLLGSTCHFLFMLRVVAPFQRPAVVLAPIPRPQPAVERAFS